jgi:hypothetical protein
LFGTANSTGKRGFFGAWRRETLAFMRIFGEQLSIAGDDSLRRSVQNQGAGFKGATPAKRVEGEAQ